MVVWAPFNLSRGRVPEEFSYGGRIRHFRCLFPCFYYGRCFPSYNNNKFSFIFFHSFSSILLQRRVFNMSRCVYCSTASAVIHKSLSKSSTQFPIPKNAVTVNRNSRLRVHVSMVDSSSSDFAKRIERAWLISKVQSLSIPRSNFLLGFFVFINWLPFSEFLI